MKVSTDTIKVALFADRVAPVVGSRNVRLDLPSRERASMDGATMSPILMSKQPLGTADVVVTPTSVEQVPAVVAEAVRLDIPITPRGRGTGNYGQAIPLRGGLVLDLSRLKQIVHIADGHVEAEAGARMGSVETAAWKSGQQLWMYPSTLHSTLGGFPSGGSCGTGSIRHGNNDEGFVTALDVVDATEEPSITHHAGGDTAPWVHSFGVAGILVRATVRTEPLQDWHAVWASFADVRHALAIFRTIRDLEPRPRLVSVDDALLAGAMPADEALPAGRASLRAIVDVAALDRTRRLIDAGGGRVEAVRTGLNAVLATSAISYNHPTWWLMDRSPGEFVHLEAVGDALVERYEDAIKVFPECSIHFEAGRAMPFVLVTGRWEGESAVESAVARLEAIGASVHNPHQWWIDRDLTPITDMSRKTDPRGVLNPGKIRSDDRARTVLI